MTDNHISFPELGVDKKILDILAKLKFTVPTPIQAKAIPIAAEGKDIIGIAQTGTGKTLAFGIPMIQMLAKNGGKGLILLPTRELALQVNEALLHFIPAFKMKSLVIIGGHDMQGQVDAIGQSPDIIIATPGRLIDHLNRGNLELNKVNFLVLDEADRMLDMGFLRDIQEILSVISKKRQTLLFSATMPGDILKIASDCMRLPAVIETAPPGTAIELVRQEMYIVKEEMKCGFVLELLKENTGSVLVFTRTKKGASKITQKLKKAGIAAAEIHSDLAMHERNKSLEGFKSNKYRVLIATDIAARGIDVLGIGLVINYDLPDDASNYVHRIGRTGRAGMEGRAITLATPAQGAEVKVIEGIIRQEIPVMKHAKIPDEEFACVPLIQLPKPHEAARPPKFDRHSEKKKWKNRD